MTTQHFDLIEPVTLDFPLNGEWVAVNTPAHRVPSHGTDYLAQRYAIDLVRFDREERSLPPALVSRYMFRRVPVDEFYGWSEPVFAPGSGIIEDFQDRWPDKTGLNFFKNYFSARFAFPRVHSAEFGALTGNYIILQTGGVFVLMAHLRFQSIRVGHGYAVKTGEQIGEIGSSGNTTGPHLHIQVMDRSDPTRANALPFRFRQLERLEGERWQAHESGVPDRFERVRRLAPP